MSARERQAAARQGRYVPAARVIGDAGAAHARATGRAAPDAEAPLVTILMCTFNGAHFIGEQLASIERQTYQNWRLVISDDGSTDATLDLVQAFAGRIPQAVEMLRGPSRGPAANFMQLAADAAVTGDYFAFCDQDDIWYPDKLSRAVARLEAIDGRRPAVYGGRTRLVDVGGVPYGHSPRFGQPPTFANALAQSIAGGNTMLLNRAAKTLFERAGPLNVVSHDWWAYLLVCGHGGVLLYDVEPALDYRQHDANAIGGNQGLRAKWNRFRMALDGGFRRWNDVNVAALRQCRDYLSASAREELATFETMRSGTLHQRLRAYRNSDIRRQSVVDNIGLLAMVVLKRL